MSNAVVIRREKPIKIDHSRAGKAKVLKFDRRAGVIMLEKTERTSKPRSVIGLVRNLPPLFRPLGPGRGR